MANHIQFLVQDFIWQVATTTCYLQLHLYYCLGVDGSHHRETSRDALLEFVVSTEISLFVYVCSISNIKSPNLYAKKFDGLFVNNNKIVN